MSRTIINGNGWYLFGVAHNETIKNVIDKENNASNCLSKYIVTDHSANVEYAYIVDKHNPIKAWITKSSNTYTANSNMKLSSAQYRWFVNDVVQETNNKYTSSSTFTYNVTSGDVIKVVITNSNNEKVVATYSDLVIIGKNKDGSTNGLTNAERYWSQQVNGILTAIDNTGNADTFKWKHQSAQAGTYIQDSSSADYTLKGPDIEEVIVVESYDSSSQLIATATYKNIGPAKTPWNTESMQKIIYPPRKSAISGDNTKTTGQESEHYLPSSKKEMDSGSEEWKNETNSTLGVWVKVINFADTVPPKLKSSNATMASGSGDSEYNQYIDIEFTKELILEYVNIKDFIVNITDTRSDSTKYSDQMTKYTTIQVHPLNVKTKNGNGKSGANQRYNDSSISKNNVLRITLPKYDGLGQNNLLTGTDYIDQRDADTTQATTRPMLYPYIFVKNTLKVTFTRSGGGKGTILKDTSSFGGPSGVRTGGHTNPGNSYYGGRTGIFGNLVNNFSNKTVTPSSSYVNESPVLSGKPSLDSTGKILTLTFDRDISGNIANTEFGVKYTDSSTNLQRNGGLMNTIETTTSGSDSTKANNAKNQTTSVTTNGSKTYNYKAPDTAVRTTGQTRKITLTMVDADQIYKHWGYASQVVKLKFDKTGTAITANRLTDTTEFNNRVNSFNNKSVTNNAATDFIFPVLYGALDYRSGIHTHKPKDSTIIKIISPNESVKWKITEFSRSGAGTDASPYAYTALSGTDLRLTNDRSANSSSFTGSATSDITIKLKNDPTFIFGTYVYYNNNATSVLKGQNLGGYTVLNDAGPKEPFEVKDSNDKIIAGKKLSEWVTNVNNAAATAASVAVTNDGGTTDEAAAAAAAAKTLKLNKYYNTVKYTLVADDTAAEGDKPKNKRSNPKFVKGTDTSVNYTKNTTGITSKTYYFQVEAQDSGATSRITQTPILNFKPAGNSVNKANYILTEGLIAAQIEVENGNLIALLNQKDPLTSGGSVISGQGGSICFGPYKNSSTYSKQFDSVPYGGWSTLFITLSKPLRNGNMAPSDIEGYFPTALGPVTLNADDNGRLKGKNIQTVKSQSNAHAPHGFRPKGKISASNYASFLKIKKNTLGDTSTSTSNSGREGWEAMRLKTRNDISGAPLYLGNWHGHNPNNAQYLGVAAGANNVFAVLGKATLLEQFPNDNITDPDDASKTLDRPHYYATMDAKIRCYWHPISSGGGSVKKEKDMKYYNVLPKLKVINIGRATDY